MVRTKWAAFVDHLPAHTKESVSVALVNEFNVLLAKTRQYLPETAEFLPSDVSPDGPFAQIGKTAIPASDLRTLAQQVLAVIDSANP